MTNITSVNLSAIPFIGNCDSTRLQMASKQIGQSLSHINCDIPYVISSNYRDLANNSIMGLLIAKDDGQIIFKNSDLLIIYYYNLQKIDIQYIPTIKECGSQFGSKLRTCLELNDEFKKNDVIFCYDCFRGKLPSFGYNAMTAYFPFAGYNYEDGLAVSENLMDKAIAQFTESVYIPIFEYTLLQPLYMDVDGSLIYFPNIGQSIKENVVANKIQPKFNSISYNSSDLKNKVLELLKGMNISNLLNIHNNNLSIFSVDPIKSKVDNGKVINIKIHRLQDNVSLIDSKLQQILDTLYKLYCQQDIIPSYQALQTSLNGDYARELVRKYIVYRDKNPITNKKDYNNPVYLIELQLYSEEKSKLGDKFCGRYANKGVVSLVIPEELRPTTVITKKPIDFIYNPFGVFSRMNLSQIIECISGKNVMMCEENILNNPSNITQYLTDLNEKTIKYFNDINYYNDIKKLINKINCDGKIKSDFIENIKQNNLFIEAPSFSKIDVRNLVRNAIAPREPVFISKKLLKFIKEKLKIKDYPLPLEDREINLFCGPLYIQKLYKISSHLINARDVGRVKSITKQPMKGRANEGGSRIGQMEIESILAHGCEKALKEMLTVKSDFEAGKKDLIEQLTRTGEYHFPDDIKIEGGTKTVASILIKFLKNKE